MEELPLIAVKSCFKLSGETIILSWKCQGILIGLKCGNPADFYRGCRVGTLLTGLSQVLTGGGRQGRYPAYWSLFPGPYRGGGGGGQGRYPRSLLEGGWRYYCPGPGLRGGGVLEAVPLSVCICNYIFRDCWPSLLFKVCLVNECLSILQLKT